MWIVLTLVLLAVLAWLALHRFRWPLFNAAVNAQRKRAGLEEKRVSVDGHDVVYLEGGNGDPLLLIHGFGANKDNWLPIAPLLAPHFRLILPDLPGFGDSTRNFDERYAVEDQVARLRELIGHLGIGPVHIGGNSMGGYLGGLYASRFPDDVSSLWLLAPAGVLEAEPSEYMQYLERGENPLLVNDTADFERLVSLCFTKPPWVPKAFQRCLCERNISERVFNEKIFSELFTDPVALDSVMDECRVKTQIVWGDNDRVLHPSGAAILGDKLANAETHVMSRMGHCPMIERPRDTADLYLAFHGIR